MWATCLPPPSQATPTIQAVLVVLVEVFIGVPAHCRLCCVVVDRNGGVIPGGAACGERSHFGVQDFRGWPGCLIVLALPLAFLPFIFSGLEEKTNSTEAWKGNLSSGRWMGRRVESMGEGPGPGPVPPGLATCLPSLGNPP